MEATASPKQWFVLRDFKKWNAKSPSYKVLPKLGVRCFTPMRWIVSTRKGISVREYVPVIQNLLFANESREVLDPIISKDPTLQYQYRRGCGRGEPMTIPEREMVQFIQAVRNDPMPVYYTAEELTPAMLGKKIRVSGGALDGYEGQLLKIQGSRKKRLVVSIPGLLVAAVEVHPDYIQFI